MTIGIERNRRLAGFLLAMMMLATGAWAQVRIGVELEYRTIMVNEPAVVTIVVQNDAEAPFVFNKVYNNAELLVSVVRTQTAVAPRFELLEREFVIMPGDRSTNLVELTSLTDMRVAGTYKVQARIRYDGHVYTSRAQAFDVVRGIELASRSRPLVGYRSPSLTYSLRYCSRDTSESAFLLIEDSARDVSYGTFMLGPIVRASPPAMNFDDKGRVVVAHQSGRDRFTRSVIKANRDGATFVSQTHHKPDGSPYPRTPPRSRPPEIRK